MNQPQPRTRLSSPVHRLLLWCVLLGLPLLGLMSSLGHLLGRAHVHDGPTVVMVSVDPLAAWRDPRRIVPGDRRAADLVAAGIVSPHHHHDGLERHHHRHDDASVIALGSAGDGGSGDEPSSASAVQVLAFDSRHLSDLADSASDRWRRDAASVVLRRSLPSIDRPPQA